MSYTEMIEKFEEEGLITKEASERISKSVEELEKEAGPMDWVKKTKGFLFGNAPDKKKIFQNAMDSMAEHFIENPQLQGEILQNELLQNVLKKDIEQAMTHTPGILNQGNLMLAGGALAAAPVAIEYLSKLKGKLTKSSDKEFQDMISKNPDLTLKYQKDKIKDYFDTVSHFAPEIASHPFAAGGMVRQMLAVNEEGIDPNILKSMIDTQSSHGNVQKNLSIMQPAQTFQDIIGKVIPRMGK